MSVFSTHDLESSNWNKIQKFVLHQKPRWWFQTCFIFIPTWGGFPFWLICFKGVETTNQKTNGKMIGTLGSVLSKVSPPGNSFTGGNQRQLDATSPLEKWSNLTKSFQMGWNHQPPPSSFFPCFMSNVPFHLLGGWTYPCKLSMYMFNPTSSNIIIVPPSWCLTLSRSWLHSDVWIFYPETSGTWFPIWGAYVFVKGVGAKTH